VFVRQSFFPKLAEIGGDLVWHQAGPDACADPQLSSLGKVGGTLRLLGANMKGQIGKTGNNSLLVGGIEIGSSWGVMPFFPDLRLTPAATVVVHDNPDLCPCIISNLQTNLTSAGWGGSIVSNDNDSASCASCPHC
jgi:hypothetical protein